MKSLCFWMGFLLLSFAGQSHPGIGIVMDSKGNVFYTDTERVWKIDKNNRKSIAVPAVHTHELFLDDQDNLYGEHLWYEGASDTWTHYVWKYSASGKFEKILPDTDGFLSNYSFVRDHFGTMFWADRTQKCQHVIRMDVRRNKKPLTTTCFENIRWMYATRTGDVLLMDFQDLVKIDATGKTKTIAKQIADKRMTKSTVENQHAVFGVWDDAQGNIYTAIASNRVVKKFDLSGKEEIVFRTPSPWTPTGGFVSSTGELWVLECSSTNAVRVERMTKDNRRIVY